MPGMSRYVQGKLGEVGHPHHHHPPPDLGAAEPQFPRVLRSGIGAEEGREKVVTEGGPCT